MNALGLIGFGEAGYHLTVNLDQSLVKLLAFDMAAMDDGIRGKTVRQNAEANSVELVGSFEELAEKSDVIFCLTSANSALPIAKQMAPILREGQIYSDLNSTSPITKEKIGEVFADSKADFVEAAIMASVPANKTKVPIYVCGKRGQTMADLLNSAGMNIKFISEKLGSASATKMLKSVLFKGFIALLTETVFATDKYGVTDEVLRAFKSIMFEEMTYEECCNYFVETMAANSDRLAAEMEQVLETLESMDENSIMTRAAIEKIRWINAQGYSKKFILRPHGYEEVLQYKRSLDLAKK